MIHLSAPTQAKAWCQEQRDNGLKIGFIATMGALHSGHIALVQQAAATNDVVVVSIFVNPLQFNQTADLENYPRTLEADLALLQDNACDLVFTGEFNDFFPELSSPSAFTTEHNSPFAQGLEGDYRKGHFEGVREIVGRLFDCVGPCTAYFGEKDFQQTLVVKELATDWNAAHPGQELGIHVTATQRNEQGLALSSRNRRLSDTGLELGLALSKALKTANTAWLGGVRKASTLQSLMLSELNHPDISIEYADVRDPLNWTAQQPEGELEQAQALIAVSIEGVRLIDNTALGQDLSF